MKPREFEFSSYAIEPERKRITLRYVQTFDQGKPMVFTDTLVFPRKLRLSQETMIVLDRLLPDLLVILGIGYYKMFFSPEVRVSVPSTPRQVAFWNAIYRYGLGEYLYRNALDPTHLPEFRANAPDHDHPVSLPEQRRILTGIGGGKDSVVVLELLKQYHTDVTGYTLSLNSVIPVVDRCADIAGVPMLSVRRILDPKVLDQSLARYHGHIPVSAGYAVTGVLLAVLYGFGFVVVGNEQSSNAGNIRYKGMEINHQWSKSSEFERLFTDYLRQCITPSVRYFSLLRPFYELRIAKIFASVGKPYLREFSSCNGNFRHKTRYESDQKWCGECPKCAFVFLILAPFIPRKTLIRIFGQNVLGNTVLEPLYRDLLGFGSMKPFDCVGTFEESRAALFLIRDTYGDSEIVQRFVPMITNPDRLVRDTLCAGQAPHVPVPYRLLGMESCLVLGYGVEGKSSEQYLTRKYRDLQVSHADIIDDQQYLDRQREADIVCKTPGIPKRLVSRQYVTATNLFFAENRSTVIGVTGSKGKSTTASLIYALLKHAGRNVLLSGNIGTPMLQALRSKPDIHVVELSSYQLDDCEYSPDTAVVTNLFPEHMDYHGSVAEYYRAKRHIIDYQDRRCTFVYNPNIPELRQWAVVTRSRAVPYIDSLPVATETMQLIGDHNIENAKAAVTVARLYGVRDETVVRVLRDFRGLPHRLEYVGTYRGIRFYDDAIATAPEATVAAIRALSKRLRVDTIFLGGTDRGYDFSILIEEVVASGIRNVVLFPDTGKRIKALLPDALSVIETESMREAVEFGYARTSSGAVCLLSTAAPSYSLWRNFEEKGAEFRTWVTRLSGD